MNAARLHFAGRKAYDSFMELVQVKKLLFAVALASLPLLAIRSGEAAIIVSLSPASSTFVANSGIQSFTLVARSTDPTNPSDQVVGFGADATLTGLIFTSPPGASADNTFGDPGPFLFTGQVDTIGSSFIRNSLPNQNIASLSLVFPGVPDDPMDPTIFGTFNQADTRVARFDIDTTGLSTGVYPLSVRVEYVASDSKTSTILPIINGNITITAIPEPTSLALAVGCLAVGLLRRRRSPA
jgi:hypothetical protein